MDKLRMTGAALTTALTLAGCTAPTPETPPMPMPTPAANGATAPGLPDNCGDLNVNRLQVIGKDRVGTVTARFLGPNCVAVYRPFNHERVGSLAVGDVFGAVCHGATPESWLIKYGPDYQKTGAVYVESLPTKLDDMPTYSCDDLPHEPFATE